MGIFRVGVILGGNFPIESFPGGSYPGWELSGGNHPGDNFPGGSFHVTEIINNNFSLGQDNKKDKRKDFIAVVDSVLNNINSRGLSKSRKASVSNHPGTTTEDILSAVEESFKTNPDTLIVYAGANETNYSRMDQVIFAEDSLLKILLGPFLCISSQMTLRRLSICLEVSKNYAKK